MCSTLIYELDIDDVVIGPKRRATDPKKVTELANSIETLGQLVPIAVDENCHLIFGLHRIEACRMLGKKTVRAITLDLEKLSAELAEIDENLCRSELPQILYAKQLARRKEIYESMHPNTKWGGANYLKGKKVEQSSTCQLDTQSGKHGQSFAEDTAAKTGKSPRHIRTMVAVGSNIDDDVVDSLVETPSGDSLEELKALAAMPAEEQREAVAAVRSGRAKSVREAAAPKTVSAMVDAKKRPIPKDLRSVFEAVAEYKALRRELTGILNRAIELERVAGAWLEMGHFKTHIEDARHALKFATPYIVCTYCKGDGCNACRQSGYLNQSPTAINEEEKEAA